MTDAWRSAERTAASSRFSRAPTGLYGEGKYGDAARGYREALAAAPKGWPRYGAHRRIPPLRSADRTRRPGRLRPPRSGRVSPARRDALGRERRRRADSSCALGMKKDDPARAGLVAQLAREHPRRCSQNPSVKIAADDISSVYETLADEREDAGDEAGKTRYLDGRASAFLDREAARATTPEQRAVFDSHRLGVALALGRPERAIPMLEQSERDFPDDYNPPARLAAAYKAMKRWDDALAASDRALTKAYGPRKLLILQNRADILAGKGDAAGARATISEALAMAESLPEGQKSERTIAALRKKLDAAAPKP